MEGENSRKEAFRNTRQIPRFDGDTALSLHRAESGLAPSATGIVADRAEDCARHDGANFVLDGWKVRTSCAKDTA